MDLTELNTTQQLLYISKTEYERCFQQWVRCKHEWIQAEGAAWMLASLSSSFDIVIISVSVWVLFDQASSSYVQMAVPTNCKTFSHICHDIEGLLL